MIHSNKISIVDKAHQLEAQKSEQPDSYGIILSESFNTKRYDGLVQYMQELVNKEQFAYDSIYYLSSVFRTKIIISILKVGISDGLILLAPSKNTMKVLKRDIKYQLSKNPKKVRTSSINSGSKKSQGDIDLGYKGDDKGLDSSIEDTNNFLEGIKQATSRLIKMNAALPDIGNTDYIDTSIEISPQPKVICTNEEKLLYKIDDLSQIKGGKKLFSNNGSGSGWIEVDVDGNGIFSLNKQKRNRTSYDIQLRFGESAEDRKDLYEVTILNIKQIKSRISIPTSQEPPTDKPPIKNINHISPQSKGKASLQKLPKKLELLEPYFRLSVKLLDHVENFGDIISYKKIGQNKYQFSIKQNFFTGDNQDLKDNFSSFVISKIENNEDEGIEIFETKNRNRDKIESRDLHDVCLSIYEYIISDEHYLKEKKKFEALRKKEIVFFNLIEKFTSDFNKYSLIPGYCLGWWQKINNGIVTEGYWWEMAYLIKI